MVHERKMLQIVDIKLDFICLVVNMNLNSLVLTSSGSTSNTKSH